MHKQFLVVVRDMSNIPYPNYKIANQGIRLFPPR